MSGWGQKRRALQQTVAGRCPLCPLSDRDCVALQYVAMGQQQILASTDRRYSRRQPGWSVSLRHHVPASRQPHRELGEVADFAVDCDRAAVPLGYDLEADRQPKSGALAGWLGREERLK